VKKNFKTGQVLLATLAILVIQPSALANNDECKNNDSSFYSSFKKWAGDLFLITGNKYSKIEDFGENKIAKIEDFGKVTDSGDFQWIDPYAEGSKTKKSGPASYSEAKEICAEIAAQTNRDVRLPSPNEATEAFKSGYNHFEPNRYYWTSSVTRNLDVEIIEFRFASRQAVLSLERNLTFKNKGLCIVKKSKTRE